MNWVIATAVTVLLVCGALFSLAAAIGINRFPDLYTRMHAASKAGTVGSGLLLLAVGIDAFELSVFARAAIGFCFVIMTAPVSAHLLAKVAHHARYRLAKITVKDEMKANLKLK